MADAKFFKKSKPLTLNQISKLCRVTLPKNVDKKKIFKDISPLNTANKDAVSFLDNKNYIEEFKKSKAGACFLRKNFLSITPQSMIPLVCDNPYHAFAVIANEFYPMNDISAGIHPKAHIETSAKFNDTVQIEPGAIVSKDVIIGSNCVIGANAVILSGVEIGNDTVIGPNSTIAYSIIGSNVKIHNGVRIGQDGFGFAQNDNLEIS